LHGDGLMGPLPVVTVDGGGEFGLLLKELSHEGRTGKARKTGVPRIGIGCRQSSRFIESVRSLAGRQDL
jgi:hypothetical protein